MKFTILTLFPEIFAGPFAHSIIKRAQEKGNVEIELVNIRDFATDKHKTVDDRPYGGGTGMILKVDVVDRAIQHIKSREQNAKNKKQLFILLDPRGKTFTQQRAQSLATHDHIVLLCGHYEGVDERIRSLVDEQISIGDYILTGGEIPAMAIVDSVVRLIPGVLSKADATIHESFPDTLEYPQYTRPDEYNGVRVPDILMQGNHKQIQQWQRQQSENITLQYRPDLAAKIKRSSR